MMKLRQLLNSKRVPVINEASPVYQLDAELARYDTAIQAIQGPLPAPQRYDAGVIVRKLLYRIWSLPGEPHPFELFETALEEMATVSRSVMEAPHPAIRRTGWEPLEVCTPLLIACAIRALETAAAYQAVSTPSENRVAWQVSSGELLDWITRNPDYEINPCPPPSESQSARAYFAATLLHTLQLQTPAVDLVMQYALDPAYPRTVLHPVIQHVLDPEQVTVVSMIDRMIEAVTTDPRYQANIGSAPLYVLDEYTFCVHPRMLEIVRESYPEAPQTQQLLKMLQQGGIASTLRTTRVQRESGKGTAELKGFLIPSACFQHYVQAIGWPSPTPWTNDDAPYDGVLTMEFGRHVVA